MGHQTRRYWALGSASETAKAQDEAAEELVHSLDPSGKQIEQAQFLNRHQGHDRTPSMESGMAIPGKLRDEMMSHARIGDDGLIIEGSHRDSNGDRIVEAYRRNGPLLEKVNIVEVQAGRRTFIISHTRGGR